MTKDTSTLFISAQKLQKVRQIFLLPFLFPNFERGPEGVSQMSWTSRYCFDLEKKVSQRKEREHWIEITERKFRTEIVVVNI